MRSRKDMKPEERQAYDIWHSRLVNDMSTPEEKAEARQRMDSLEWTGTTGPVMEKLGALEDRIEAMEKKRTQKAGVSLKEFKEAIEALKADLSKEAHEAAVEVFEKLYGG